MRKLVEQKKFMIVGALYDVVTGQVDFELPEEFATDENVDFLSAQFKKHSPRVVPSPKADQKF